MTPRCTELDLFFDGELEPDQAAAFRDHLATCERCQRVLLGRMQEAVAADAATEDTVDALDDAVAGAGVEDPMVAAPEVVAPDPVVETVGRDADLIASARASLAAEAAPVHDKPVATTEAPAPITDMRRAAGRRRILIYAAPVIAAVVALPLLWPAEPGDGAHDLEIFVEHSGPAARSPIHVGDVLRTSLRGGRHRAIWVYFEDRDLAAICPNGERCDEANGELVLRVRLTEGGRYTLIGLTSEQEIPPPTPGTTLDETLAHQSSAIHHERRIIVVD